MNMNILIADDDRILAHSIATRLNKSGLRTFIAMDAMQAIMMAMRMPMAAVVLDVNMPGGTGLEVLKRLRSNTRTCQLPILVLTGSLDADLESTVRALGADEFVAKSGDLDGLVLTLERLVNRAVHN